jgi:hypothetical protein
MKINLDICNVGFCEHANFKHYTLGNGKITKFDIYSKLSKP